MTLKKHVMTLGDLMAEVEAYNPTPEDIEAMYKRVEEAGKAQEAEARAKRPTNEWLNRECDI
jgi:hypothetical protein